MDNGAIGRENPEFDKAWELEEIETSGEPSSKNTSPSSYSKDSMTKSRTRRREKAEAHDPRRPRLQDPSYLQYLIHCQIQMSQLADNLMEQWNRSLQEEADKIQQELKSPKYRAWQESRTSQYAYEQELKKGGDLTDPTKDAVEYQAATVTATTEEQKYFQGLANKHRFILGLIHMLEAVDTCEDKTAAPVLAVGAGFASSFTAVPDFDDRSQLEAKILHETWSAINPNNGQADVAAGWFTAMWSIGLIYGLSAQSLAEQKGDKAKEGADRLLFARSYAQELIASLQGDTFSRSLQALLAPLGEDLDAKASLLLVLKGKLALVSIALALIYKLKAGADAHFFIVEEGAYTRLFTESISLSENGVKRNLQASFHEFLRQLPKSEQEQMMEHLLAYLSTDPSIEDLLDQQKVFDEILSEGTFEHTLVDKRPLGI